MGPSIYYPTPRTPLFERCRAEGILPPTPLQWRSSAFPIETKEFDRLDLVTLFRLTRVINFVKDKMDHGEIEEGITWRDLFHVVTDKTKDLGLEEGQYRTGESLNPSSSGRENSMAHSPSPALPGKIFLRFNQRSWREDLDREDQELKKSSGHLL